MALLDAAAGKVRDLDETGAKLWDIEHIKRISRFLTKNVPPGGHVLAQWPGYLLEADFDAIPGTENHFGARAAIKLGVYVQEEYKVVSPRAMADSIKRREPDAIVLSPVRASALPIKVDGVRAAGYRQVVSEHGASVFVKAEK